MKRVIFALIFALAVTSVATGIALAQESRRFTIEEMMKVRRVADPRVSPDGKWVAFTIGDVNFDGNRVVNQIYVTSIVGGSEIKRLTSGDKSSSAPRWSPDGKKIAFVTGSQIWVMDSDGGDKQQVTKISTGAGGTSLVARRKVDRFYFRGLSRLQRRRLQQTKR